MKNERTRLGRIAICFILSLCMVVTMMPAMTFAETTVASLIDHNVRVSFDISPGQEQILEVNLAQGVSGQFTYQWSSVEFIESKPTPVPIGDATEKTYKVKASIEDLGTGKIYRCDVTDNNTDNTDFIEFNVFVGSEGKGTESDPYKLYECTNTSGGTQSTYFRGTANGFSVNEKERYCTLETGAISCSVADISANSNAKFLGMELVKMDAQGGLEKITDDVNVNSQGNHFVLNTKKRFILQPNTKYRLKFTFDQQTLTDHNSVSVTLSYSNSDSIIDRAQNTNYKITPEASQSLEVKLLDGSPSATYQWYSVEYVDDQPSEKIIEGGNTSAYTVTATKQDIGSGKNYRCTIAYDGKTEYIDYHVSVINAGEGTEQNPFKLYDFEEKETYFRGRVTNLSNLNVQNIYFKFTTGNIGSSVAKINSYSSEAFSGLKLVKRGDTDTVLFEGQKNVNITNAENECEMSTDRAFILEPNTTYILKYIFDSTLTTVDWLDVRVNYEKYEGSSIIDTDQETYHRVTAGEEQTLEAKILYGVADDVKYQWYSIGYYNEGYDDPAKEYDFINKDNVAYRIMINGATKEEYTIAAIPGKVGQSYQCGVTYTTKDDKEVTEFIDYEIAIASAGAGTLNNPIQIYNVEGEEDIYRGRTFVWGDDENPDIWPDNASKLYFALTPEDDFEEEGSLTTIELMSSGLVDVQLFKKGDMNTDLLADNPLYRTYASEYYGATLSTTKAVHLDANTDYIIAVTFDKDEMKKGKSTYEYKATVYFRTDCSVAGHVWDKGTVTEPTDTEPGKVEYTCYACHDTKTVTIPSQNAIDNAVDEATQILAGRGDNKEYNAVNAIKGIGAGEIYTLNESAYTQLKDIEDSIAETGIDNNTTELKNVSIVGGVLNAPTNDDISDVSLVVGYDSVNGDALKALEKTHIDELAETADEDMVAVSMNLVDNNGNDVQVNGRLAVPVLINFDIPVGVDPNKLVIVHKKENGAANENEIIYPTISEDKKTASIVVNHFSDFLIVFASAQTQKEPVVPTKPETEVNVDSTSGGVIADIGGETKVEGDKASAVITADTAKEIVAAAAKSGTTEIKLDASVKESVDKTELEIPMTIAEAADTNGASVEIATNVGSVVLDKQTVKGLAKTDADSITVTVEKTAESSETKAVFDITLTAVKDGKATTISRLQGTAQVVAPLPSGLKAEEACGLYLNGKLAEKVTTKVDGKNVVLTVKHFSTYGIMSNDEADKLFKTSAEATTMGKLTLKTYKGGKIKASWKNGSGNTGDITKYQVYYKQSGKKAKYTTTTSKSKTIKKLKKGKKYTIKTRAYIKINGKTYKSKWTTAKKIKCK